MINRECNLYETKINNFNKRSRIQSRVSCGPCVHDCTRDHGCTSYAISREIKSRHELIVFRWNHGRVQAARSECNRLCQFDEIHSLGMRFSARLLGRGRKVQSLISADHRRGTRHAAWFYNSRSCPRKFPLKSSEFTASCANNVSYAKLIPR